MGGSDFVNQFLASIFEGESDREDSNCYCNCDIMRLLSKLEVHRKDGRDSFVTMAHVNGNKGFFHELDGGRIIEMAKYPLFKRSVLGFQKLQADDAALQKYKIWLGYSPICVEGSDCKSTSKAGAAYADDPVKCYVKLGATEFAALKGALLDGENRVKCGYDMPNSSNARIESIAIKGGKLDGNIIQFNADLNTLIGTRGSGKSAVIELLRWALDIDVPMSGVDRQYKNDLVEYMLGSGGKATVYVVDANGKEYRIEKIYGQRASVFDAVTNEKLQCLAEAVRGNIVYFGQSDLSNKQEDVEAQLLRRLIGHLITEKRAITEGKTLIAANLSVDLRKIPDLDALREETQHEKANAEQKLKLFKEKGIEDKLYLQTQLEKDLSILRSGTESLSGYAERISDIINDYAVLLSPSPVLSAQNAQAQIDISKAAGMVKSSLCRIKEAKELADNAVVSWDSAYQKATALKEAKNDEFAKIKRSLNSDTLNPDTFIALNRIVEIDKLKLLDIDKQEKRREELLSALDKALDDADESRNAEWRALKDEADKINAASKVLGIKITLKGRKDAFTNMLKEVFKGTGIRNTEYEDIATEFCDMADIWRDIRKGSVRLERVIGNAGRAETFKESFKQMLPNIISYRVEDSVSILYKGKPLSRLSLGQRASALLLFLFTRKEIDTLIIDQPEDDLDNSTIYDEVVKELIHLKGQMQFIFATHNANIPVLGDGEKIISCSFDSNRINLYQGTIDSSKSQKTIVDIMEGGGARSI